MKNIILIGAGGNASVILSTIIDINKNKKTFKIIGFLDDKKKKFNDLNYLGQIKKITINKLLKNKNNYFIWTLISTTLGKESIKRLEKLNIPINRFPKIIHPTATVSSLAKIGKGSTIHPNVNIGPNVKIGNHVHIFAQSMIGHDTHLASYCYVANSVSIGASIRAGRGVYFGSNSSIIEKIKIYPWTIVGLGSVLLKSVKEKSVMAGNPAKKIR
jgi:acetyltransferase EpsM